LANVQKFPATGWTTAAVGLGSLQGVVGDDGDIKAGAALSYTDNGDGTTTDNNTKLVWENKGGALSSDLHDYNNTYPWSGLCQDNSTVCGTSVDCTAVAGTAKCTASDAQGTGLTIFQWVAQLNAAAFAGHSDWRVPNVKELQSIVDYGTFSPAIAAAFTTCFTSSLGCTVTMCNCTQSGVYWSSSQAAADPTGAFGVNFGDGGVNDQVQGLLGEHYVRAVRGGL
jgi:hypothetical protein